MEETFSEIVDRARGGSAACQIQVGHAYLAGEQLGDRQLPQDYDEARKWLELAHEQDSFTATYLLGTMHEEGRGVPADVSKAISLYEKAASRGAFLACVRLARIHADGKGVSASRDVASHWYRRVLSFEGKIDDQGEMQEARSYLAQS
jgi:TPR repeat protein